MAINKNIQPLKSLDFRGFSYFILKKRCKNTAAQQIIYNAHNRCTHCRLT